MNMTCGLSKSNEETKIHNKGKQVIEGPRTSGGLSLQFLFFLFRLINQIKCNV